MGDERDVERKLDVLVKLTRMQLMPKVSELKKELVTTDRQKRAYDALDGTKTITQVAGAAGYTDESTLKDLLPTWESRGLIISVGKGPAKKYVNIENLEV
jgi:hypothetical protein